MPERRRRKRVPLRCALSLRSDGRRVAGYTVDISSKGFYCVIDEAFSPGDSVECILNLRFPSGWSNGGG
ncbi:MAG: PilZ domain-containing protein, partial [bacterium]|nr:PilZ domain-containing protein [bacterium]